MVITIHEKGKMHRVTSTQFTLPPLSPADRRALAEEVASHG